MTSGDGHHNKTVHILGNRKELLAEFDRAVAESGTALASATDQDMNHAAGLGGSLVVSTEATGQFTRTF
jgi:hypothetical protein